MKPWEKYQTQGAAPAAGPWQKYAAPAEPAAAPEPQPGTSTAPPFAMGDEPSVPWQEQTPDSFGRSGADEGNGPAPTLATGVQGVGRGVANLVGAPVDLTTAALNGLSALAEGGLGLAGVDVDVPSITRPVGGSDMIVDNAAASFKALSPGFPLKDPADMGLMERGAYNVNALGTEALLGGTILSRAGRIAGAPGGPRRPTMGDAITQPYRENPAGAVAVDTAAGLGAGGGLTAAEELAPDSPLAQLFGVLAGGMGGATAARAVQAPHAMAQGIRSHGVDPNVPYDPDTSLPATRRQADAAALRVQGRETPGMGAMEPEQAAETIGRRAAEYRAGGDPMPTTGLVSDDPGLVAMEQAYRGNKFGTMTNDFTARDAKVRGAARDRVTDMVDETADPRAPQQYAERTAGAMRDQAQRGVDQARGRAEGTRIAQGRVEQEAQRTAAPVAAARGTENAASERLDDVVVNQTMRPRGQQRTALIDQIDPDGAIERDATGLVSTVREIRDSVGDLTPGNRILPEDFLRKIDRLAPKLRTETTGRDPATGAPITRTVNEGGSGKATVRDLLGLRPHLKDARQAAGNNLTLRSNLDQLRRDINDEIDRLAAEAGPGSAEARAAQDFYRKEYAPFFAQGKGGELRDAINRDNLDRVNTPPTKTAERFRLAGGAGSDEALRDLRRIIDIAPSPDAGVAAVRDYVTARLATTLDAQGRINPATLGKWVDNNRALMSEFPEIGAEVQQLRRDVVNSTSQRNDLAQRLRQFEAALKRAEKDATATERRIANSQIGVLLNKSPDKAVSSVLNAPDPERAMRETQQMLGRSPAAQAGWKRAVTEHLVDRVTNTGRPLDLDAEAGVVSNAKLTNLFKQHEDVLSQVYSPEEMNSLRRVHKLLAPFDNLSVRATSGSPTSERQQMFWNVLEGGLKATYGVLKGGGILRTLRVGARTLPDQAAPVEALIGRMWFDPELAQHLLTRDVKQVGTPAWNAKLTRLLGYQQAGQESSEADPDAP